MSVYEGMTIRRTTAAQQVANGLSERILSGKIMPGRPLRESAIATELGVARNTVREAVRILELSGLVRHEVNRGAVVIAPTIAELDSLYAARRELEIAGARSRTGIKMQPVRESFAALRAEADTHDVEKIVTADLAFHASIVAMMGSKRIDDFYQQLTRELRYYLMVLSFEDREFERSDVVVAEHEPIMSALESGDSAGAADAIEHHIEINAARLTEIMASRS